jgi:putative effector of murein hydrolase LrgA (UPF0299 family)
MDDFARVILATIIATLLTMIIIGVDMRSRMSTSERKREDDEFDDAW